MRAPSLFDRLEVEAAPARRAPALVTSVPKSVRVGRLRARLEVGTRGWLRAWLKQDVLDERAALCAASELPGNVRFARTPAGTFLVADAPLRDRAAVGSALDELRAALDPQASSEARALDDERLRALLQGALTHAALEPEALVERDGDYELRPRFSANAIAVRVTRHGAGLAFERVIAALPGGALPGDERAAAVTHEALRWNARLRGARLVLRASELLVQSRLGPEQLQPARVAETSRAVAAAVHHALPSLRVLAKDRHAARIYAAMFLPQSAEPGPVDPADSDVSVPQD